MCVKCRGRAGGPRRTGRALVPGSRRVRVSISFSNHLCPINHSDPFVRVYTRRRALGRRRPRSRPSKKPRRCCAIYSFPSLTLSFSTLSARRCPARHTRLRASTQHLRPSRIFDGRFNKPTPTEPSNWRDPIQASSNDSAWLCPHRASTHGILPLAISCATVR